MVTTMIAALACVLQAASPVAVSPSPSTPAPTSQEVVDAVFDNLDTKFHPAQCPGCKGEVVTIGSFVRNTLVALAESERKAPKHSWESAECRPEFVDDEFIAWAQPEMFSPKLAARLERLRGKELWFCELAWGFGAGADDTISPDDTGEIWWSDEIKVLLADEPGHPVIPDSFAFNYTP